MPKKKDLTLEFKIAFLEEYAGIDDIDFDNVPSALIDYYIELKLRDLI